MSKNSQALTLLNKCYRTFLSEKAGGWLNLWEQQTGSLLHEGEVLEVELELGPGTPPSTLAVCKGADTHLDRVPEGILSSVWLIQGEGYRFHSDSHPRLATKVQKPGDFFRFNPRSPHGVTPLFPWSTRKPWVALVVDAPRPYPSLSLRATDRLVASLALGVQPKVKERGLLFSLEESTNQWQLPTQQHPLRKKLV